MNGPELGEPSFCMRKREDDGLSRLLASVSSRFTCTRVRCYLECFKRIKEKSGGVYARADARDQATYKNVKRTLVDCIVRLFATGHPQRLPSLASIWALTRYGAQVLISSKGMEYKKESRQRV
jgi:hypothetical protein